MVEVKLPYGVYRIRPLSKERLYLHLNRTSSHVSVRPLGQGSDEVDQRWDLAPVENKPNTYTIRHFHLKFNLSYTDVEQSSYLSKVGSIEWIIKPSSSGHFSFTTGEKEKLAVELDINNKDKILLNTIQPNNANQLWLFEKFEYASSSSRGQTFTTAFFPLTAREAANQDYDIIVVGSGVGGGVLIHDIYDTNFKIGPNNAKKVLLLERGGLTFHSHCLNTARPVDLVKDRSQQNDFFFRRFWGKFDIVKCCDRCTDMCGGKPFDSCCNDSNPNCCDECCNKPSTGWYGGPMYNLGGRSAAWGLFIPRIHDRTLQVHFPKAIGDDLLTTYYRKAEYLMNLSLPRSEQAHRHVVDRLNAEGPAAVPNSQIQWSWARIASEFQREDNYSFARGAYSSIDKILEMALGRENDGEGPVKADPNVHVALNAEVRSLIMDWSQNPPVAIGVNVRTPEGDCVPIFLKDEGSVVLSAGSVNSAAILLRTGGDEWRQKIEAHRGLHVTDHDIYTYSSRFRYKRPTDRVAYGAMKLQAHFDMDPGTSSSEDQQNPIPIPVGLANMSIDSSSFLSRGVAEDSQIPNFIITFIRECRLHDDNSIQIDPITYEPRVTIRRGDRATGDQVKIMQRLTWSTMKTIETAIGATFINKPTNSDQLNLSLAALGVVAHELGTLPMRDPSLKDRKACLDDQLKVVNDICNGVYVCDLACFPFSPEVNPTLTLAALAIRLSRHLVDRTRVPSKPNWVSVVNHSGAAVRIRLSNLAGEPGWIDLAAGDICQWERKDGITEALFVRGQDANSDSGFLSDPVVIPAHPGGITVIGVD
ncbi:GMC oxidoreductase [Rhizoctonia solani AG-3 Rhs1AP]|uniref:GMC oxidoreductase n=2 Tax=Rhizoctonia solani AG-3 TaxID=1086053 RepID=A0A074RMN4_9AGAM|nr:GMC oxidoreductase [Rhizoctonia solani AG-3 Rhs1AP]KEP45968.1 GMC oxidoreductase [Rhizoctonia solani 123E]